MTFFQSIKSGFVNFLDLRGRASRSEFWYFHLFVWLVGLASALHSIYIEPNYNNLLSYIFALFHFIIIIPLFTLTARRLHDVNKSAFWMLLGFTIIGIIPLIYWYCKEGDVGQNDYGSPSL